MADIMNTLTTYLKRLGHGARLCLLFCPLFTVPAPGAPEQAVETVKTYL